MAWDFRSAARSVARSTAVLTSEENGTPILRAQVYESGILSWWRLEGNCVNETRQENCMCMGEAAVVSLSALGQNSHFLMVQASKRILQYSRVADIIFIESNNSPSQRRLA